MSLQEFKDDPWRHSHGAYGKRAFFHIEPAPEFATGEVIISSLYRACGLGLEEVNVPATGKEFVRASQVPKLHKATGSNVDIESWRVIINAVLESPKQKGQSSRRFLQMSPIVPDVALYSGSARLSGNSWNPGNLVRRMVAFGCDDDIASAATWERLFKALGVDDGDDIWARWLQDEFKLRRRNAPAWSARPWSPLPSLPSLDKTRLAYPARQFVRDLEAIIRAKPYMTRRQWVSLLEAVVRLGSVAHVLWLCEVNHRVWRAIQGALAGDDTAAGGVELASCDTSFLTYGKPAAPIIRDYASRYLIARLGINAVLWQLEELGTQVSSISTLAELEGVVATVRKERSSLLAAGIMQTILELREGEKNARAIACKKGIGSNLVEFSRYVLGQRQTTDDTMRGYDQGYILRKKGDYASAQWIVSMGPVSILALVHCCLRDAAGPRSIQKLCQHLGLYGIGIHRDDVNTSDLGKKLRTLGLVLDSPDAESGMLLITPFDGTSRKKESTP
jgi:hypothetical protein